MVLTTDHSFRKCNSPDILTTNLLFSNSNNIKMSNQEIAAFKAHNLKPVGVKLPILLTLEDLFMLSQPQAPSKPSPISPLNIKKDPEQQVPHTKPRPKSKVKREAEETNDDDKVEPAKKKLKPSRPLKSKLLDVKPVIKETPLKDEKQIKIKMGTSITPEKEEKDIVKAPAVKTPAPKKENAKTSITKNAIKTSAPKVKEIAKTPSPKETVKIAPKSNIKDDVNQKKMQELQVQLNRSKAEDLVKGKQIVDLLNKTNFLEEENRKLKKEMAKIVDLQNKVKSLERRVPSMRR